MNEDRWTMRWKHRMPSLMLLLTGLPLIVSAGSTLASSATFSFTMERRGVHGKKNKMLHSLDAGELTLSGGVWVVSKNRGSSSSPDVVTMEVRKVEDDSEVCSASVAPSTTFNQKTSADKACGRVQSGTYYVFVSRATEDGWHVKGSGTLVTK